MASVNEPRYATFKANGAIPVGSAVKIGTDRQHVAKCTSTTDKSIGIAQSAATAAEDAIEVAMPGGGARGLAQTTISAGDLLTSHTDGALKPSAAAATQERIVGVAQEDAVAGDIFSVDVQLGLGAKS